MDNEILSLVYIKCDSRGVIYDTNSGDFLHNTDGWILIDRGCGDKYKLARSHYLPGPKYTDDGIPRYCWNGEKVVERSLEEIAADIAAIPPPPLTETALLKAQVQALTARGEFMEDVIAELAMMVL